MMELSEGWAPLCKILGTRIPDELFPRANNAEAVEGLAGRMLLEAGSRWAGISAVVGVVGYGAWSLWQSVSLP
jgi:hypothetical protein